MVKTHGFPVDFPLNQSIDFMNHSEPWDLGGDAGLVPWPFGQRHLHCWSRGPHRAGPDGPGGGEVNCDDNHGEYYPIGSMVLVYLSTCGS